jgi:hypothetical protein
VGCALAILLGVPEGIAFDVELLVVTANLDEAYGREDTRAHEELDRFVAALLERLPALPDAVMVQEVTAGAARYLARALTEASGAPYVASITPRGTRWSPYPRRRVHSETGILLNTQTLRAREGGFVRTTLRRANVVLRSVVKENAYVVAQVRGTDQVVPLASIHLPPGAALEAQADAEVTRSRWVHKIVAFLGAHGRHAAAVIAGDFNDHRTARFWRELTSGRHGLRDALAEHRGRGAGVDFIFSASPVIDAGVDASFSSRRSRYSDHRFRWSLIGV